MDRSLFFSRPLIDPSPDTRVLLRHETIPVGMLFERGGALSIHVDQYGFLSGIEQTQHIQRRPRAFPSQIINPKSASLAMARSFAAKNWKSRDPPTKIVLID